MGAATTLSTPQEQVDQLIHQVAEENGLEIISQLDTTETPTALPTGNQSLSQKDEDQLSRRWDVYVQSQNERIMCQSWY